MQPSVRGRTRLTTVISITCRSLLQLLHLLHCAEVRLSSHPTCPLTWDAVIQKRCVMRPSVSIFSRYFPPSAVASFTLAELAAAGMTTRCTRNISHGVPWCSRPVFGYSPLTSERSTKSHVYTPPLSHPHTPRKRRRHKRCVPYRRRYAPLPLSPSRVPETCCCLAGGTSIEDMLTEILLCHNRTPTDESRP